MAGPQITVWAGFRTHLLIPHTCVGALSHPLKWDGWTIDATGTYWRDGEAILNVSSYGDHAKTRVVVRALREIWLQEPCLEVTVAGDGAWRGYGIRNQWTKTTAGVDGWLPLKQKDAHKSTVHFTRARSSPDYTVGVEYRDGKTRWRIRSDGRFANLLDHPERLTDEWEGCQVFSRGWKLAGGWTPAWEPLKRWELAGKPPDVGQMYFLGWPGGPGVVVNNEGRTPTPGMDISAADRYDRLYSPDTFRRLQAGDSIEQTLSMRRL